MNVENLYEEMDLFENKFFEARETFWNSLTKDEQLLAFCSVVDRLYQGEIQEGRSYRGVLYDTFGFGYDSYVKAQISHFLELHNSLVSPENS